MAPALPWFPVVGILIGDAVALLDWLCSPLLQPAVRSVAVLALLALVTGGLHLDGFIDCCDGLFGHRPVERRLEIMRDSRVGAYGVIGGILLILAEYAALVSLPEGARAFGIIMACLLGRWSMVYAVVRFPYTRAAGVGAAFRGSSRHLAAASVLGAALLFGAALVVSPSLVTAAVLSLLSALVAAVVTLAWTGWASHRLGGGLTGDTYGAQSELVTLAVLVSLPSLLSLCARL